jgi:hypothetical protein
MGINKVGTAALADVVNERLRQDRKWGEQNHINLQWNIILGEEYGEVQKALVEDEFRGLSVASRSDEIREELVQTAAVALAWIECIDRRKA